MRSRLAIAWAIALFVATALVVAACGGDDNSSSDKGASTAAKKPSGTVTLWIMNNGPQPVPDMEKTLQPFTQKTGIKVKVELVGWDVQFDRIRNAAVSGEAPDVTQAGTTQVPFFAALGGLTLTASTGIGSPVPGQYTLESVAAIVLGGVSLAGGRGGVFGPIVAVIILQLLRTDMTFLNVNTNLATVVNGAILIGVVMLGSLIQIRRERVR